LLYPCHVLIALTGGIGSGKSTVAKRWVELGATEIDADLLAREVVMPGTEGLAAVLSEFGSDLELEDGTLDRAGLASRAFATPEARLKLEAILHPRIQARAQELTARIQGVVVYTIPLFVETKSPLKFDAVVTISAPESVRVARLVNQRGMSEQEALARIQSQASDAEREAVADVVISSDCGLDELLARAEKVYYELTGESK
jgi:dephospho-CoA kinase